MRIATAAAAAAVTASQAQCCICTHNHYIREHKVYLFPCTIWNTTQNDVNEYVLILNLKRDGRLVPFYSVFYVCLLFCICIAVNVGFHLPFHNLISVVVGRFAFMACANECSRVCVWVDRIADCDWTATKMIKSRQIKSNQIPLKFGSVQIFTSAD